MAERVVITGYGAISPLGLSVQDTWAGLVAGTSGIDKITGFDTGSCGVTVAGQVKGFDPLQYMAPDVTRHSDHFTRFAVAAATQAITHAGLLIKNANRYRTAVIVGSSLGGSAFFEQQGNILHQQGARRVSPYTIPVSSADNAPARICMQTGIRGINLSVVSSCASGTDAIGTAYRMIQHEEITTALAGGAEAAITPLVVAGFSQLKALSHNTDPVRASRPFDLGRDGFVIAEGAAILVLESLTSALKRGAVILAEIAGYGATSDGFHITHPHPTSEPAIKALKMALKDLPVREVDYINAHGTSTRLNDAFETRVIKQVFGRQAFGIPISSSKSMLGHMLGAAGALEAIICCEVIRQGVIPPTINLTNPDPECDLDYVPNTARAARVDVAISNSFGFGGHNAALVIKRYQQVIQ